jgi:hypothetical protein
MEVNLETDCIKMPDFLIVGAAKSGTTSLFHYLNEHPEIFMPKLKETWFFHLKDNPNKAILDLTPHLPINLLSYAGLFQEADKGQVCGEASPSYLYYHQLTIENIKKYYKDWKRLKIIIILREPIEKVISHFNYVSNLKLDPDKLSLKESLLKEKERIKDNQYLPDLFYVDNTLYYNQVLDYKNNFPNLKIYLYDELKEDPLMVVKDLYQFLNVDTGFNPNTIQRKYNASDPYIVPRNKLFKYAIRKRDRYWHWIPPALIQKTSAVLNKKHTLDEETLTFLKDAFKQDVLKLQTIIDKDISHWISKYE